MSLVVVVAVIICPQASFACSCQDKDFIEDHTMTAPLIFRGEVAKSEFLPRDTSPIWYGAPASMRTSFEIKAVLKGRQNAFEDIYSSGSSSSCGIEFPRMVGRSLVIAAYEANGKLFTDFCSFWHLNRGLKY
jgi:hypothetical protein